MKFTRTESGVVEVNGCQKCPHVQNRQEDGGLRGHWTVMYCMKTLPSVVKTDGRKLVGKWMGPYHASCPLPSEAEKVP